MNTRLETFRKRFDALDTAITHGMAKHGLIVLRIALGVVFVWFGALKFFPDISPAEDLVRTTVYFVDPDWFIPLLATWEVVIGIGLLLGIYMRATLALLFLQLPGTALPLVVLPEIVWEQFPFVLTIEGQYIVKNVVIVGAALVLGGTVRGGRLVPAPPPEAHNADRNAS